MITCLITGCDFIDVEHNVWCHGDLHELEDCYIFNAVLSKGGEAAWQQDNRAGEYTDGKWLAGRRFFERRGVIVIAKRMAALSDPAVKYISKARERDML